MPNTIAAERKRLGLSQEELGAKIGRSRTAIGRWEENPLIVSAEDLTKLVNLFGCSSDYLLGLTNERTPYAKVS